MKTLLKKLFVALPIILVFATISSSIPDNIESNNYSSETTIQNENNVGSSNISKVVL